MRRIVTRVCLDKLKSAQRNRETYIGPWLPDPLVEAQEIEDVTLPLMLALERLSPLERAAFLLHDVFGLEFEEVGAAISRDEATCRQLAHRARTHVRTEKPRFKVESQLGLKLAEAFFAASRSGDANELRQLLAADVSLHTDGGGKRPALREPVAGLDIVVGLLERLATVIRSELLRVGFVNGLPGFVSLEADGEIQTTALETDGGKIVAIYVVRNPDKLRHLH
jgi:RNA polymerase sigma-70 factor (ECF subfamily)